MLRLRPVPLEPERVLELDRLLLSVSRDDSVAAISFSGAVEAAMRAAAGLPAAAGRRGGHPAVLLHHAGVPV